MPNYLINLSKKIHLVWNSQVPRHLFYAVWAFVFAGFLIYAARFSFLGFNYYGLPRYPDAWIFWIVGASFLALGYLLKTGFILYYLSFLPLIYFINLTELLRIGNFPVHAFDFLAIGCLVGVLPKNRCISLKTDWSSFMVGCFGCVIFISSVYSLVHPSFSNSIAIIFSVFGWNGDYNEFNGAWMGHNALAGCLIYFLCINSSKEKISFEAVIHLQFLVFLLCLLMWFFYSLATGQPFFATHGFTAIPNAPKHDLAGWLVLLFGFFFGWMISTRNIAKKLLYFIFVIATTVFIYLSAARSGMLVIPVAVLLGYFIIERKKSYLIKVFALMVISGVVFAGLQKNSLHGAAGAFSSLGKLDLFTKDISFFERTGIWANAINIFIMNPIVGAGFGSSTSIAPHFSWNGFLGTLDWRVYADVNTTPSPAFLTTRNVYNAHSDLLEIAASTGLVGLSIFLSFSFFLLVSIFQKIKNQNSCGGESLVGVFVALSCYFIYSQADTRISSFLGSCAMWQFIALGACALQSDHRVNSTPKRWLWPAVLPIVYIIGCAFALLGNYLPPDRTYGVWNWTMRDSQGNFLIAKEAQFLIPPFEEIEGLNFKLTEDYEGLESMVTIQINDLQPIEFKVSKLGETNFSIAPLRTLGEWTKVKVSTEKWAGRGALGSLIGVKPYALAMNKVRPIGYRGISDDITTQPRYFFQK